MRQKSLVRSVSRSFSLSLLSLPRSRREFVSLTYLVARIADTIADSGHWSLQQRLTQLDRWEKALFARTEVKWTIEDSVGSFSSEEAELLLNSPSVLKDFLSLPQADRQMAEELFQVLFQGMRYAIEKYSKGTESAPVYINETEQEFDYYCYAHAGCVGSFWAKAFGLPLDLEAFAIEYGKALERINILRDLQRDRKLGRIHLPRAVLQSYGIESTEPWRDSNWPKYFQDYVTRTKQMLLRGAFFCDSIPMNQWRLRWASMMPLKIGISSLRHYEKAINDEALPKIKRKEVYQLALKSFWDVCSFRKISKAKDFMEVA